MRPFDSVAMNWMAQSRAPAVSCAVLHRGILIHAAGYGTGTPQTIYQTASVGKQFTAALALLLAAEGHGPQLDEPVAEFLPEMPKTWFGVTLRHLLSHTSGIPEAGYDWLHPREDYSDEEIAHAISSGGPLSFPPGSAFRYSNTGYVLSGIAIGRRAGAFYGDLLRDRIFGPLGMHTAEVNSHRAPVGYTMQNGVLVPAPLVSLSLNRLADGGISMSVLDMARWESALAGEWGPRLAELFDETLLEAGIRSGYGLGFFLRGSQYGRVAEHTGEWQGFSSAKVRYLEEGFSAVVLANLDDADAEGLAHALIAAARGV